MLIKRVLRKIPLLVSNQFTSIGGQAVIEGVMMRSPHAFVIAVRKKNGDIRIRRDQWFGLGHKYPLLRKPFIRGILVLIETMANGIVSLNYSAHIAMEEEATADESYQAKDSGDQINFATFLSILVSFLLGAFLFVFVPHGITAWYESYTGAGWGLNSFKFHTMDGVIKSIIFVFYIFLIGLLPDIKRVFQYHGAEHKSISAFESGEDLTVENAKKYSTFHPRCGTTFIFFLLFISIIFFALIFTVIPIGKDLPFILKHLYAILFKVFLTVPIAALSFEIIKSLGKHMDTWWGVLFSYPGKFLQKLTTREPDDEQLEVAIASIKTVLLLEEKYELRETKTKVITRDEIDIKEFEQLENSNYKIKDFLEL
jgi:uncharacterized protein YqhQ